jgi:4-amino-4-deoxy-L-arabinose transferase-like glycosyltransferase
MGIRHDVALSLLNGHGFEVGGYPSLYLTPLYPLLIAVCYAIFGVNGFGVSLLQAGLSVICGYFIIRLIDLIGLKRKVTFFALVIFCFYPYLAISSISIFDTVLFTTLLLGCTYYFLSSVSSGKPLHIIAAGIFAGFGLLTRPTIIFFCLAACLWLIFEVIIWKIKLRGGLVRFFSLLLLPTFLIGSMWTLRNFLVSGQLVPTCLAGKEAFWYGNNQFINDIYKKSLSPDLIGSGSMRFPALEEIGSFHGRPPKEQLLVAEAYENAAKKWIKENPVSFFEAFVRKVIAFWSWEYFPKNLGGWEKNIKSWNLRHLVYEISYFPILVLALWSLFRLPNRHFVLFLLLLFALFSLAHGIMVATPRHRVVLDPLLIILAAERIAFLHTKYSQSSFSFWSL